LLKQIYHRPQVHIGIPAMTYRLRRWCIPVSGTPHLLSDIFDSVRLSTIPAVSTRHSPLTASDQHSPFCTRSPAFADNLAGCFRRHRVVSVRIMSCVALRRSD